jgi:ribosomal protein L11 methyltransferase
MQLVVHLSSDDDAGALADVACGRLWLAGAAGIEERPGQLIATFASPDLARAAHAALGGLDVELRDAPPAAEAERWRAFARPFRVATDTVVVPTWWDGPIPDATLAVPLDPGSAFGFGNHPTTAALASRLRQGSAAASTVLDLGCGSGLLSIVAALSGARSVVAVDIDPEARAATQSNAERNQVTDRVTLAGATITDAEPSAPFDLILANVPIGVHEETATTAGRMLSPAGAIWATGMTEDQVGRVIAAHQHAGAGLVAMETVDLDGEWWLVVLAAR